MSYRLKFRQIALICSVKALQSTKKRYCIMASYLVTLCSSKQFVYTQFLRGIEPGVSRFHISIIFFGMPVFGTILKREEKSYGRVGVPGWRVKFTFSAHGEVNPSIHISAFKGLPLKSEVQVTKYCFFFLLNVWRFLKPLGLFRN